WLVAAGSVVAALALVRRAPAPSGDLARLAIDLPENIRLDSSVGDQVQILAISPDGRRVAFRAEGPGEHRIFIRDLTRESVEPVGGTEGGADPFFSPDGEWLGFIASDKLQKTAIRGGTPITLAPASRTRGAVWGADGTIVFSPLVNSPL